jgi:hypothetical protein
VQSEKNLRQINERQFRRLCGHVWADCLLEFEAGEVSYATREKERKLLICLSKSLSEVLEIPTGRANATPDDVRFYRSWIDGVMARYMAEPFDYQKVINRLVREVA